MRCTRCDRIAVPQAVGRTPDGVLVFGWCLDCLAEVGCSVQGCSARPYASPDRPRHHGKRPKWPRITGKRRLAGLAIAGLLAVWAAVLATWGALGLPGPDGRGRVLLGGGLVMALLSFLLWLAVLPREMRPRATFRVLSVALTVIGVGLLIRGTFRRDPVLIGLGAAIVLAWAAWTWTRLSRTPTRRAARQVDDRPR